MRIPLASNGLTAAQISAGIEVLQSGQLTMGERVKTFETMMSDYLGVRHFVMVNSGSSANLAILEALVRPSGGRPWLRAGDEVIVPAIAWPTTVWPVVQLGLTPVFVDVDEETIGLSFDRLEKELESPSSKAKAIFAINPLGLPLDESRLVQIATRFGLTLIIDNCESLGSRINGQHSGKFAIAASYSFYFSHHITTMEGGGIGTDNDSLADDLRAIRSHGWSRDRKDSDLWNSMSKPEDSKFLFVTAGYNIRPTELQAALGPPELDRIPHSIARRQEIASKVEDTLSGFRDKLRLIGFDGVRRRRPDVSHSWMMLPLLARDSELKGEILAQLSESGIETRPILTGNFLRQPAAKRLFSNYQEPGLFTTADKFSNQGFMIGCHHDYTNDQISYLTQCLERVMKSVD
jgi:CDP-6-deoxy-D-xylo-4-hexulose-3-dehydrase